MIEFIEHLEFEQDHNARISVLLTFVVSTLKTGSQRAIYDFPLQRALEIGSESVLACRRTLVSAEAANLARAGLEPLLRAFGLMVFLRCGLVKQDLETTKLFLKHLPRPSGQDESTALMDRFTRLLKLSTNWIMVRHEAVPLGRTLRSLKPRDQVRFDELKDILSELLSAIRANDELEGGSGQATELGVPSCPTGTASDATLQLRDCVKELRVLRAKSQLADRALSTVDQDFTVSEPATDEVHLFLLDLGDGSDHRVAGIAQGQLAYHIWYSSTWSEMARRARRLPRNNSKLLHQLDAFHTHYARHPHTELGNLFAEGLDCEHSIKRVTYSDLTHGDVPLAWVGDSTNRYAVTLASSWQRQIPLAGPRNEFSFWGRMHYQVGGPSKNGGQPYQDGCEQTPTIKDTLAPARREQRMFEQNCRIGNVPLTVTCDAAATRTAFLKTNWRQVSVLHLVMHGIGHASDPEQSFLMFAPSMDRQAAVTFVDVLSLDWSQLELVFLNACLTGLGPGRSGETGLSMAWAFKAGGARAVIAHRWLVDDEVACYFADQFYRHWLGEESQSIERAFQYALRSTQNQPQYSRPSSWGSFVLLQ
ncbi:MAG TPA: CHAT domain-containing protein [Gemmataceae bacterium]|nr:CHAT domain-containing protein [Gemmataceae bacterium]